MNWFKKAKKPSTSTSKESFLPLKSITQLQELISAEETFLVFKHSTRCSISSTAYSRVASSLAEFSKPVYLLDVISNRDVSNELEASSGIKHESPQLISFVDGKAVKSASHLSIHPNEFYS
ncbi:MAG: bacillithiol system redox-active protein YtxJ [Luteibaculum sp.]